MVILVYVVFVMIMIGICVSLKAIQMKIEDKEIKLLHAKAKMEDVGGWEVLEEEKLDENAIN